jgi:hypothetical protein
MINEKESARKMYGFEPGEAFDLFYEGLTISLSGSPMSAAKLFEKSIAVDSTKPATYMYLVMMYSFMYEPNAILKDLCSKWVEVANTSHDETQIYRATESLKFHSATDEERRSLRKAFGKMFREMRNGR